MDVVPGIDEVTVKISPAKANGAFVITNEDFVEHTFRNFDLRSVQSHKLLGEALQVVLGEFKELSFGAHPFGNFLLQFFEGFGMAWERRGPKPMSIY